VGWLNTTTAAVKRGDVLTGPWRGRMLALTVISTLEGGDDNLIELSGSGLVPIGAILGDPLVLDSLPAGWRHVRGQKVLHKGTKK